MSIRKKEIIFLIRAYNDLDIQLSLIREFAEDTAFRIRVIGYPCDGDMGSPRRHEAAPFMREKYGISFETVLDAPPAPLHLRLMYRVEQYLLTIRQKNHRLYQLLKLPHVAILMLMRKILQKDLPWLEKTTASWNPEAIIIDEVFVQKGRSFLIDKILKGKNFADKKIFVIQTGQTTYFDSSPNKTSRSVTKTKSTSIFPRSPAQRFFVPGMLDKEAVETNFPNEKPEIHGNLRMDRDWIKTLHEEILIPPYLNKQKYLEKLPQGSPKVVFMLSKLGYGIRVPELKNTIRTVANLKNVACAIKPHTRGMKFDFMSHSEIKNCAIVPNIPSAILIEWADIILFTGSSIAFHAMILGKRVGFLQNCQYIKTIFDDGVACDRFDSTEQLKEFLIGWGKGDIPPSPLDTAKWLTEHVHGGTETGLTARHYKEIIMNDLLYLNL